MTLLHARLPGVLWALLLIVATMAGALAGSNDASALPIGNEPVVDLSAHIDILQNKESGHVLLGLVLRNEAAEPVERLMVLSEAAKGPQALLRFHPPTSVYPLNALGGGTADALPMAAPEEFLVYPIVFDAEGELALAIEADEPLRMTLWRTDAWAEYLDARRLLFAALLGGLVLLAFYLVVRRLVLRARLAGSGALAILFSLPFLAALLLGGDRLATWIIGPSRFAQLSFAADGLLTSAVFAATQSLLVAGLCAFAARAMLIYAQRRPALLLAILAVAAMLATPFAFLEPALPALASRLCVVVGLGAALFGLWRAVRQRQVEAELLLPGALAFLVVAGIAALHLLGAGFGSFLSTPLLAASLGAALALTGLGVVFAEERVIGARPFAVGPSEDLKSEARAPTKPVSAPWIWHRETDRVEIAPWLERLCLMPAGSLQGPPSVWASCLLSADRQRYRTALAMVAEGKLTTSAAFVRLQRSDGSIVPLLMRFSALDREAAGTESVDVVASVEDLGALGIASDHHVGVGEEHERGEAIMLAEPAFALERMRRALVVASEGDPPPAMAVVGIEGPVEALTALSAAMLARRLVSLAPRSALVSRLMPQDGPRFLVSFPDGIHTDDLARWAARVRDSLSEQVNETGAGDAGPVQGDHSFDVAIGASFAAPRHKHALDLLSEAEAALKTAYDLFSRFAVFDPGETDTSRMSGGSEADEGRGRALRAALGLEVEGVSGSVAEADRQRPFYPIDLSFLPEIALSDRTLAGVELVPVWPASDSDLLGHDDLADIAFREGIAEELASHLLLNGVAAQSRFQEVAGKPFSLTIALPHLSEWRPGLGSWFKAALEAAELDPEAVLLAMPASLLDDGGAAQLAEFTANAPPGSGVALTHVSLPIAFDALALPGLTAIKLHPALVRALPNPHAYDGLSMLAAAAGSAGLDIIADGVDEEPAVEVLAELGVSRVSGAVAGVPMSPAALRQRLAGKG